MSYTQADKTAIKNAIIALATGDRVVRVTFNGRTTEYASTEIDKLRALLSEISADLSAADGDSQFYLTSTSKGL